MSDLCECDQLSDSLDMYTGSSASKKNLYIYTNIYMKRKVDANTPATLPLLLSLDK